MNATNEPEIDAAIEASCHVVDGRHTLTCSAALHLADELEVSAAVIGERCDALGVKVRACQLGCF